MKNPVAPTPCPECHGSGMSFATELKGDGFAVTWTRCECFNEKIIPIPAQTPSCPIFL